MRRLTAYARIECTTTNLTKSGTIMNGMQATHSTRIYNDVSNFELHFDVHAVAAC